MRFRRGPAVRIRGPTACGRAHQSPKLAAPGVVLWVESALSRPICHIRATFAAMLTQTWPVRATATTGDVHQMTAAFVTLCLIQIARFSQIWLRLTRQLLAERHYNRVKSGLRWDEDSGRTHRLA